MRHVQVEVWDADLSAMYAVIKPLSASFRDARGETGAGQLEIDYDARYGDGSLLVRDRLLAWGTVIRHVLIPDTADGVAVPLFAWMVEEITVPALITEGATIRVSGRGILCWLERGIIHPARGWRRRSIRERQFGFGANDVYTGGMGVTFTDAVAAPGAPATHPTFPGTFSPIWAAGQPASPPAGQEAFFLTGWTEDIGRRIRIDAAGDDAVEVWIDGEKVIDEDGRDKINPGATMHGKHRRIAAPGAHWVMVRGRQVDSDDMADLGITNPGEAWVAVRVAVVTSDDDADEGTPLGLGWDATVEVPGWNAGFSLRQMMDEADGSDDRGVLIPFSWGFGNDADSNGVDLPHVVNRSWTVGTDLLRFAQDLMETGVDIWATPDKVLKLALTRGVDRTGEGGVRLYPAHTLTDYRVVIRQRVRNTALVSTGDGFIRVEDADSVALYGRLETSIDLASTDSLVQAEAQALEALQPLAYPQRETDGDRTALIPFTGATPYVDFLLADVIEAPDGEGGFAPATVMAVAWTLSDSGDQWAAELDLAQKGARRASVPTQQRVLTIAQSGGAASAGGNVRSATKR